MVDRLSDCCSFCCLPWRKRQRQRTFHLFQSLPTGVRTHVMTYMTPSDACKLINLDSHLREHCVTLDLLFRYFSRPTCPYSHWRYHEFIDEWGKMYHPPSNSRLLHILESCGPGHFEQAVLCDLCHTTETHYLCQYWGLYLCSACRKFDEPDFPVVDCKYFVHFQGENLIDPLFATGRLWARCTMRRGALRNNARVLLAEPASDPYTGELCGPLITYKLIKDTSDNHSSPAESVETIVSSVDGNSDPERLLELSLFVERLQESWKAFEAQHKWCFRCWSWHSSNTEEWAEACLSY